MSLILKLGGLIGSLIFLWAGLQLVFRGLLITGGMIVAGIVISSICFNLHELVAITWGPEPGPPAWYQATLALGQAGYILTALGVLRLAGIAINNPGNASTDSG